MDNNVIRFKKPFKFNVGTIIFAVLFIYLIIVMVSFFMQKKVATYEVTTGDLSSYYSYQALAIRNETVVQASSSGSVTYFAGENSKVGAKSVVYALDKSGNLFQDIAKQAEDCTEDLFSPEKKEELLSLMDDFSYSYSDDMFYETYSFHENLNLKIVETIAEKSGGAKFLKGMSAYYAYESGVVLYETDDCEDLTINTYTKEDVLGINYSKKNLKQEPYVEKGQDVYKLVTDENWYLVALIDESLKEQLAEQTYVDVTLKKDDFSAEVPFSLDERDGDTYIILELSTGMIRYASERYLDIDIVVNQNTGYKIPNSAIRDIEFCAIPKEYLTESGNSKGFLKVSTNKKGEESVSFVAATLYSSDDDYYYIHEEELLVNDQIQMPDSTQRMKISESISFPCVFCVNKGYAVLRRIEVVNSNEDYTIVKMKTPYGISNYDHIILDSQEIEEGDLIF